MKALTIRQPHIELILDGTRCSNDLVGEGGERGCCVETRSWPTGYRGPVMLHAGARWDVGRSTIDDGRADEYPRSAVLGTAQLVACVPIRQAADTPGRVFVTPATLEHRGVIVVSADGSRGAFYRPGFDPESGELGIDISDQLPFGHFVRGSFGWLLANVRRCTPIPAPGRQGLWEWKQ